MKKKIGIIILLGLILLISCKDDNPIIVNKQNKSEWVNVSNGLPSNSAYIIKNIGGRLFVLANYKIYSSTNNGDSWEIIGIGLPDSTRFMGIVGMNGNLALATEGEGIYTSTNFGETWSKPALNGLDSDAMYVTSIEVNQEYLFIGAGTQAIIYRSADFGENWTQFNDGLPSDSKVYFTNIMLIENNEDKLFACPAFSGIYYSKNNGENWASMNEGLPQSADVSSFTISNSYYFATIMGYRLDEYGLYRRGINGSSWEKLPIKMTDWDTHFVIAKAETILVSSDLGIEISYDNGNTWEECNLGLDIANRNNFYSAIVKDNYVFVYENYHAIWRYLLVPKSNKYKAH